MKVHGNGIYATIPLAPYEENNVIFLQSKDKKTAYVYYLSKENDLVQVSNVIHLENFLIPKGNKISFTDDPKVAVKFTADNSGSNIILPAKKLITGKYAVALKLIEVITYLQKMNADY